MTVDLAHRLSLIARNLEQAQTSLDSAFELLQTIIESNEVQSPATRELPQSETPPNQGGHLKAIKPGERKNGLMVHSWIIRQFMKQHSQPFNIDEIMQFAKSLGYLADRRKINQTLHNMRKSKTIILDSQGLWKAPSAKA
jgi:HD-GYP domain-containing protein (c-di-GMP phosphodiesterase class II)